MDAVFHFVATNERTVVLTGLDICRLAFSSSWSSLSIVCFMNAACLLHFMPVRPSTVCLLDLLLFLSVKCFCAIAYLVSRVAGGWLVVVVMVAQWLVDWLNLGGHSTLYATPCVAVSQYVQSFELSASHRPQQPHTTTQWTNVGFCSAAAATQLEDEKKISTWFATKPIETIQFSFSFTYVQYVRASVLPPVVNRTSIGSR